MYLTRPTLLLPLALLIAGCSTSAPTPPPATTAAPQSEPEPEPPPPATPPVTKSPPAPRPVRPPPPPPPPPPKPAPLEAAAEAVVARLAAQMRLSPDQILVTQVNRAEWPDSCLGLAADGEICNTVITPGFAVSVTARDQRYEFRTDESGRRIRVAAAPLADTGDLLVNWRDSQSFAALILGRTGAAYGLRGRPLLGLPLPSTERIEQLDHFVAKYGPFQARTPAGEVTIRGEGSAEAIPAEHRMVAEWAAQVANEVGQGLTKPTMDEAVVWNRSGGIAGFCDRIIVGRSGWASAWSCRSGQDELIATTPLEAGEAHQLFQWLDRLEPFSWSSEDLAATADGMTISLECNATGLNPVTEAERQEMLAFVDHLLGRLLAANGVDVSGE